MTGREYVDQLAGDTGLELLTCDGMDDAIIGIAELWNGNEQTTAVAYDYDKCISGLIAGGMSQNEAEEFFSFNVVGAYLGLHNPVFITFTPTEPAEPIDTITQPG